MILFHVVARVVMRLLWFQRWPPILRILVLKPLLGIVMRHIFHTRIFVFILPTIIIDLICQLIVGKIGQLFLPVGAIVKCWSLLVVSDELVIVELRRLIYVFII